MKIPFLILLILFVLFIIGCNKSNNENPISDKGEIPVRVICVEKENLLRTVATSGQFSSEDETLLAFKTGGVISRIFVKEGDKIRKGQIIASLDLTEINANVSQAKAAYQKAERDLARVTNLYKDSVVTLEQVQNASTFFDLASKSLDIANFNQAFSTIKALNDGFVLRKYASEGQVVSPGSPVLQTNGAIANNWVLKVGVSDKEWSLIELNDRAEIEVDALPDNKVEAFVYKKSESIDPNTGVFEVFLKIKGVNKGKIASGLFGKAVIYLKSPLAAWSIPYDAILDGDHRSGYIFVTNDLLVANKIKVDIRNIVKDRVIVESGLEGMKYLIVSGNAYLTDNSKIKVVK
ncbi:MAG: efflux RND transporter periplasmic adaptor subunit [Candidatus Kapabacteria bacterium]|nr:efflux RND transporter periplasmic adaptor subunit [Candidatus Kapabacteria bacterium]